MRRSPRLEVLRLVLVVVNSEDVEVLSGEVDDFLAPDHVVRALLSARHDSRLGSDGSQPAAVDVDDLGVLLRCKAVVHGLVVDLEVPDAVGLGMPVGRTQPPPFGRGRVVEVVNPVHGVLNLIGVGTGRRQHDQRLGVELPAEPEKLLRPEAVVVRVAAPDHVGVVSAGDVRADAVLPLVCGSKGASGPTNEGRSKIAEGLQQVGAQHTVTTDVRAHHRDEVEKQCSTSLGCDLYRSLRCPARNWRRNNGPPASPNL